MRGRATAARLAAGVFVVLGLSACGGSPSHVRLTAGPARALYDTPVSIRVSGLKAGQTVELRATSVDVKRVTWASSARFVASRSGVVTTRQAPHRGGGYSGANAMGLFELMKPTRASATTTQFVARRPWRIAISVRLGGKTLATRQLTRLLPRQVGVTSRALRPPRAHVYGELYLPPDTGRRGPAVVAFGGSEGGLSTRSLAASLAAHGYAALALAYFDEPGLPRQLKRIPLEYFATAIRLLGRQPGVDSRHILVSGASRGSEAAQLLGADFPSLVHGVIALTPSGVPGGALPGGRTSAWTLHGHAVPYPAVSPSPDVAKTPPATIPVERIDGPILLVCGEQDQLWPSCPWTDAIVARLATHHAAGRVTVIKAPGAGHHVNELLPYVPETSTDAKLADGSVEVVGGTPAADMAGRAKAWPALLRFLGTVR